MAEKLAIFFSCTPHEKLDFFRSPLFYEGKHFNATLPDTINISIN